MRRSPQQSSATRRPTLPSPTMPMHLPCASWPVKSPRSVKLPARSARSHSTTRLTSDSSMPSTFGDRLRIAAGLIDDKDAALAAGFDVDGVVASAVGGDDEQVRRMRQKLGAGMVMPRELVAGRAGLIGMRSDEHGFGIIGHAPVVEHIEAQVVALAEHFEIAVRHVRLNQKYALVVDDIIHCWRSLLKPCRMLLARHGERREPGNIGAVVDCPDRLDQSIDVVTRNGVCGGVA